MVRSKSNTTSLTFPSADASSRVPSLAETDASASDVEGSSDDAGEAGDSSETRDIPTRRARVPREERRDD
jgi:hypothetical protein